MALQKPSVTKSPTLRLRSFRWFILPSFLNPTAFREHTQRNPSSCWSSGWAAKLHNATSEFPRPPFLSLGGAAYEIHCRLESPSELLWSDSLLRSVQTFFVKEKVLLCSIMKESGDVESEKKKCSGRYLLLQNWWILPKKAEAHGCIVELVLKCYWLITNYAVVLCQNFCFSS